MLLVGAEFIAMLVVIVYVGAVAVLFLFVVMMLDIDFASLRSGFTRNLPFGLIIALVLMAEIGGAVWSRQAGPALSRPNVVATRPPDRGALGQVLDRPYLGPLGIDGADL